MPDTLSPLAPIGVTTGPLPASRKTYVAPDHDPSLRVPVRMIDLSDEALSPVPVYDCSGPIPIPTPPSMSNKA
jgi:hydroxymethylpyrimidine synthase